MLKNFFESGGHVSANRVRVRRFKSRNAGKDRYKLDLITINNKALELLPQCRHYDHLIGDRGHYDDNNPNTEDLKNFIKFNTTLYQYLNPMTGCSKEVMDRYKEKLILEGLKTGILLLPAIHYSSIRYGISEPDGNLSIMNTTNDILSPFIFSQIQKNRISAVEAFKLLTKMYDTDNKYRDCRGHSYDTYRMGCIPRFVMRNFVEGGYKLDWSCRDLKVHNPEHDKTLANYIRGVFNEYHIPFNERELDNYVKESKRERTYKVRYFSSYLDLDKLAEKLCASGKKKAMKDELDVVLKLYELARQLPQFRKLLGKAYLKNDAFSPEDYSKDYLGHDGPQRFIRFSKALSDLIYCDREELRKKVKSNSNETKVDNIFKTTISKDPFWLIEEIGKSDTLRRQLGHIPFTAKQKEHIFYHLEKYSDPKLKDQIVVAMGSSHRVRRSNAPAVRQPGVAGSSIQPQRRARLVRSTSRR